MKFDNNDALYEIPIDVLNTMCIDFDIFKTNYNDYKLVSGDDGVYLAACNGNKIYQLEGTERVYISKINNKKLKSGFDMARFYEAGGKKFYSRIYSCSN